MARRRIPDPKIGGSIPSEVIVFFYKTDTAACCESITYQNKNAFAGN